MTHHSPEHLGLAPGVIRLRPDDHFMVLMDAGDNPMTIGALLLFNNPPAAEGDFASVMRTHFLDRLGHTPLPVRLVASPDGYDSDAWADIGTEAAATRIAVVPQNAHWSTSDLRSWLAQRSVARLDLTQCAFAIDIIPLIAGDLGAVYIRMHHAVADGIGFQTILGKLSDQSAPFQGSRPPAHLPEAHEWRRLADARFFAMTGVLEAHRLTQQKALAELQSLKDDPTAVRARTPDLGGECLKDTGRAYATASLSLSEIKAVAARLGGTVNDIFMAMASGTIRQLLLERDILPPEPIVVNSARSYRRTEHGDYGNRIVALHPHLATHLPDPVNRLRAIQVSMAAERRRTHLDEAMLDQPERPYGARDRRTKFRARAADGGVALPGNVSLSNVPGPSDGLSFAGHILRANYPVPIIGNGRFLNITSRRNADRLDVGIMAIPSLVTDIGHASALFSQSLHELRSIAS